ncbi:hypothetical protein AVEN_22304-1, partial [Araneus ventricosus]
MGKRPLAGVVWKSEDGVPAQ